MSVVTTASATTRYYGLPIFEADDKPSYLTDWNGTMTEIDALLKAQHDDIEANKGDILGLLTRQNRLENALNSLDVIAQTLSDHLSLAEADIQTIKNTLIQIDTEVKNTSSRVTALTTRVDDLETRADGFDTSISGLASEVQEQESDITALEQTVGSHTTQIAGLSQDIDTVDGRALANTEILIKFLGAEKYSSSETYAQDQFVYTVAQSNQIISFYRSKVDDNTGNPLSDDTKWEYKPQAYLIGKLLYVERYANNTNITLQKKGYRGMNARIFRRFSSYNKTKMTFPITFNMGSPANADGWGGTFDITAYDTQGNTQVAGKVGFVNPSVFTGNDKGKVFAIGQITLATIRNLFDGLYVTGMRFVLNSGRLAGSAERPATICAVSPITLDLSNGDVHIGGSSYEHITQGFYAPNDAGQDGAYEFVGSPFVLTSHSALLNTGAVAPFDDFDTSNSIMFAIEMPFGYADADTFTGTFTIDICNDYA